MLTTAETLTNEALREALENLSYRERRVIELRYGLGDQQPRTLDEVGRAFNVTRERIRQIEHKSLKKLQELRETQRLRDDIEIAFNTGRDPASATPRPQASLRTLNDRPSDPRATTPSRPPRNYESHGHTDHPGTDHA